MGHAMVVGGARASAPVVGIRLGDIAEGQLVKLLENGTSVEFYVAKHDYESALNGSGRTLLVRKDYYHIIPWNSYIANSYANSNLDSWLNNTYKTLLDSDVQTLIETTKFYYTPGNGTTTVNTLERSIFQMSLTELGKSATNANTEGSAIPISSILQIAYHNGTANTQWTRTPRTGTTKSAFYLNSSGNVEYGAVEASECGTRPCFTFPSGALFDEETMLFNGKVVA